MLNGKLVFDQIAAWITGGVPFVVLMLTILIAGAISLFLGYIIILPVIRGHKDWRTEKATGAATIVAGIETHRDKHIAAALGRDDGDAAIISRALTLAKSEGALLSLIHVVDSAPTHVYSSEVYDEHTREDEQYLYEIASEIRASGVPVEIGLCH